MSFTTIAASAADAALTDRITAAAVQEAWNNPGLAGNAYAASLRQAWPNAQQMWWPVCIAPDVEAAYASALAAHNPNPGGDPTVVTDGMILSNVQAKWPEDPAA